MSSDTQQHHELLSAVKAAQGTQDGSFEKAVTRAFEHLDRLNSHVSTGGSEGEERALKPDESPTLR